MIKIGPSFPSELLAAGLIGLPFAWGSDGVFEFDSRMTQAQIDAVRAVYTAHDPTKPAPPSPLTIALAKVQTDLTVPASVKAILALLVTP